MKTIPPTQIISDNIWRPLVHIPTGQRAFLVHPGTTLKPQELSPGWHWHWPLLTSIRQINPINIQFLFNNQRHHTALYFDEPITAVSRDHHLYSIQGSATLNIDPHAEANVLAKLNRHILKRIIRPLIRQSVRQAIAQYDVNKINMTVISQLALEIAQPIFANHGITVQRIEIVSLEHYQPQLTQ